MGISPLGGAPQVPNLATGGTDGVPSIAALQKQCSMVAIACEAPGITFWELDADKLHRVVLYLLTEKHQSQDQIRKVWSAVKHCHFTLPKVHPVYQLIKIANRGAKEPKHDSFWDPAAALQKVRPALVKLYLLISTRWIRIG